MKISLDRKKYFPVPNGAEVRNGFADLLKLGLLTRDQAGRLSQSSANVASDDEVALSSVARFHREMMARASESIDRVPREKRDISGMTIGMSLKQPQKLKR